MVFELDPLHDPRWQEFLSRTRNASVFHTSQWLKALQDSYGYTPVVFTLTPPGRELSNGIVLCRVNSRFTGRRLVSLPFSDHCEPLFENVSDFHELQLHLRQLAIRERLRYVEIRPLSSFDGTGPVFKHSEQFFFHTLDLRPQPEDLFQSFHKTAIRQPIGRAEREGLRCEAGNDRLLLQHFYTLFVDTRKRQGLPPTPLYWFSNLLNSFREDAVIRIAFKGDQPIAGTFCLKFKKSIVYKYGCSDKNSSNLGAVPFLLWLTIKEARAEGIETMDMGRSDMTNAGLITFKDRWGATKSTITYLRFPDKVSVSSSGRVGKLAKSVFGHIPDSVRIEMGKLLYRHIG